MKLKENFQLVNVADEFLAIPLGEEASSFQGVVVLSEASYYLLGKMNVSFSEPELVKLLIDRYSIERDTAEEDIKQFIAQLNEYGMLENSSIGDYNA